ncbi:hypothetical protein [Paenibacillus rigui]|uniref:hypothetical protein n=1 Tax=Paenibacillus rigui TaxID=554312 RepID=UPI0015C58967|nr:hypothetical protein [Paenibacillus rigui]
MTNGAAIGYMMLAAKSCGLDEKKIKELERDMYLEMDMTTEEEAEEYYRNN